MRRLIPLALALALAFALSMSSTAAADEEPLFDELKRRYQSAPLKFGALVQAVGLYAVGDSTQPNDGFGLANFRLSLGGKLDESWGYFLQASFIKRPAILDAAIRYKRWSAAQFEIGAMKAPFSAEFLTSAARIDFVSRSQVITALAPGRQVGLQVKGMSSRGLGYAVGVVNGNGVSIANDDSQLMTVVRGTYSWSNSNASRRDLEAGINAYHSRDTDAPIGVPITGAFIAEGFSGERVAAGADIRLAVDRWLFASELVVSRFDPRGGARVEPYGYYVTMGFHMAENTQLLVRWDSFAGDGVIEDSDLVVLGLNYWPTTPTEVQLNAVFPTTGSRDPRFLVNVQVAF
jgi:hypothetical protein